MTRAPDSEGAVREVAEPFERIAPIPPAKLAEWLASVASGEWIWPRNSRCKYVNLKIDTRAGAYRIEDRDGKPISFDELLFQYHPAPDEPEKGLG